MKTKSFILIVALCLSNLIFAQNIEKINYDKENQTKEILKFNNNNLLHGKSIILSTNPAVKYNNDTIAIANYYEGKKHGKWFIYHPNGNLAYELNYKMGEKSGTWKVYNNMGTVIETKLYQ